MSENSDHFATTRYDDPIENLQQMIGHGGKDVFEIAPAILATILDERLWESRNDRAGESFKSFEAFVTHRLWEGLNSTIDDLLLFLPGRKIQGCTGEDT